MCREDDDEVDDVESFFFPFWSFCCLFEASVLRLYEDDGELFDDAGDVQVWK